MRNIPFRIIFVVGLLIALLELQGKAQYENGSLVGTIHDATGAVVGGASVSVTNLSTAIVTRVTANASGDYEVPSLRVGIYGIKAEAPGFAPAEAQNISIAIGARQHIDLTLTVGQANATTVEVTDIETAKPLLKLLDAIESQDDVQNVYANFELSDDALAKFAA